MKILLLRHLLICVLCAGVIGLSEAGQYSPEVVKDWPEYAGAQVTALKKVGSQKPPQNLAPAKQGAEPQVQWPDYAEAKKADPHSFPEELPKETKAAAEKRVLEIAKRVGLPKINSVAWVSSSKDGHYLRLTAGADGEIFSLFDHNGNLRYFKLKIPQAPAGVLQMTDAELITTYSRDYYRNITGVEPIGEVTFARKGKGMETLEQETVTWTASVEGVTHPLAASVGFDESGPQWEIDVSIGAAKEEIRELEAHIQKHPVRFKEKALIAVALKSVEALPAQASPQVEATRDNSELEWFLQSRRGHHEFGTWVMMMSPGAQEVWTTTGEPKVGNRYCQIVTLNKGLYQIQVTLDWTTGKVVEIHRGMISW